MILQQVPMEQIKKLVVKTYYDKLGQESSETKINHKCSTLFGDVEKSMLYDLVADASLLFSKVDINDVFPYQVDISDYEITTGQLPVLTSSDGDGLNEFDTTLKVVTNNVGSGSIRNRSTTAVSKFKTFVKITGLVGVGLEEVVLIEDEGILQIKMADTHPMLFGTLKVKTW